MKEFVAINMKEFEPKQNTIKATKTPNVWTMNIQIQNSDADFTFASEFI